MPFLKHLKQFSTSSTSFIPLSQKPIRFPSGSIQITTVPKSTLESLSIQSSQQLLKSFPECKEFIIVQGPRGISTFPLFPFIQISIGDPPTYPAVDSSILELIRSKNNMNELNIVQKSSLVVKVQDDKVKYQRMMQGTTRAHLVNMIQGVTEGFVVLVRLVGIGYRCQVQDEILSLRLGFCHPIELPIPQGIKVDCISPTRILLSGNDKQITSSFAAKIRKFRPPEPFNQKGIFVNDETIKKKEGKKR